MAQMQCIDSTQSNFVGIETWRKIYSLYSTFVIVNMACLSAVANAVQLDRITAKAYSDSPNRRPTGWLNARLKVKHWQALYRYFNWN